MINKSEVENRFRRSINSYDDNASVQKVIIARVIELLKEYCPEGGKRMLEVGCGTGLLTRQLCEEYSDNDLYVNDLVTDMCIKATSHCHLSSDRSLPGDIETLELPEKFDRIVSSSTFQWFTSPSMTFAHLAQSLSSNGWMIFSTFGPDNFHELRSVTGVGLVYYTINEMKRLLAPYYEVVYEQEEYYTLRFKNPLEILHHMKKTGVNATEHSTRWTRSRLEKFVEEYARRFQISDSYPLTYQPHYFVCKKK